MKFEAYIRLEQLADDVKRANKVKIGAKVHVILDCEF